MHLKTANPLWHGIYAACFGSLVIAGAIYSGIALRDYQLQEQKSFLKGQVALDIEHYYNENFIARDLGSNLWALINYSLFHEGRVGVVIGEKSWLFTLEEVKDYPEVAKDLTTNLAAIDAVAKHVRAQGSDLLVALVPEKAAAYAEHLGSRRVAPLHSQLYSQVVNQLRGQGVSVVDTIAALENAKHQAATFLKSDTHWTPFGAQVVAKEIAQTLQNSSHQSLLNQQVFSSHSDEPIRFQGDLLNYIPLGIFSDWVDVSSDQLVKTHTQVSESGVAAADDLFGDTSAQIALVGTSYSANANWNFSGALKQQLGADLVSYAQEGKGPFVPMTDYLKSADFTEAPPALIIWEIPVRFLPAHQANESMSSLLAILKGNQ
jgi:alginate O-acetyltransferase complex protein AlgJ